VEWRVSAAARPQRFPKLLQQIDKLLDRQAGLLDDVAERPAREVSVAVEGPRRLARRVVAVHHPMVAAAGPEHNESRSLERPDPSLGLVAGSRVMRRS
jgi:hypothetical protein